MSKISDPLPNKDEKIARRFGLSSAEDKRLQDVPVGHFGPGAMCQQDWQPTECLADADIQPVRVSEDDLKVMDTRRAMPDSSGQPSGVNLDTYWSNRPSNPNP